jgi:hypothetical protein
VAANVAAAGDGGTAIDHDQLIVHAVIEAAELERNLQRTGPARAEFERIEHAHFDVRQGIEQQRQGLVRANTVIVDQESHADATLGGGAQPVHEHDASRIVIVDVGLDVDGPGGLVGQLARSSKASGPLSTSTHAVSPGCAANSSALTAPNSVASLFASACAIADTFMGSMQGHSWPVSLHPNAAGLPVSTSSATSPTPTGSRPFERPRRARRLTRSVPAARLDFLDSSAKVVTSIGFGHERAAADLDCARAISCRAHVRLPR